MKRKYSIFNIGPLKIKIVHFVCKKCKIYLNLSADVLGVKCPKCNKDMVMGINI